MSPIKILITATHYPVASGRYIAEAFRRLGHDVKTAGPCTGADVWGIKVDERHVWNPDRFGPEFAPIDLWIHADSAYSLDPDEYDHPMVLWGVDNHARDYAGRDYAAMFLAHSWGARMTEHNAHWLPCAYDPFHFYDAGLDRRNDVACIGVPYEPRQEIVMKMRAAGLNVYAGLGALYEEYNAIYNTAKIALVKSFNGDLAQRFFENMAQGCCVLSDYTPDAIRLGFEPYKDFWVYNGADEATAAAKWLIESGEWQRIARNGWNKVQGHTWDARAEQLLRVMGVSQ
jgi:hypothetical protein